MTSRTGRIARLAASAIAVLLGVASTASAQTGSLRGTVVDAQGGAVPRATVTLLRERRQVRTTSTRELGEFTFDSLMEGRYQVEVTAPGFQARRTDPVFAGAAVVSVVLQIGPLTQDVVVSAAAVAMPQSQVASPVTVIDAQAIEDLGKVEILEPLRTVPGVQVQSGAHGGLARVFVRGGNANFNKILIDGMPVNEIGGAIDPSPLTTAGTESIEVLRTANSVLYGSDALSGVVSITTQRGRYRVPEAAYSIDGGSLGMFRQAASIAGAVKRFDYFSEFAHFRTDNDIPNNDYRNATYAGRFGVVAGHNTTVSGTLRWFDTAYGDVYAFDYFLVPDDSRKDDRSTVSTVTAHSQWSDRFRTTARYGIWNQNEYGINPAPTGEPSDPFGEGPNYVGKTVTIHGANGYSTTGRAILDLGGEYPDVGTWTMRRQTLSGQGDYDITPAIQLSGGGRVEHERAMSSVFSVPEKTRRNGGAFLEGRATARDRVYVTAGIGIEHNTVFGNATTPRISVGVFVRKAPLAGTLAETKLTFNAGTGIKAPNVFVDQFSLAALIPPDSPLAASIPPIGPERSRGIDVGVEQGLWHGRARARVSYFRNEFSDVIQFVRSSILPELGVPPDVANEVFGAYVNAASYTAQGIETSVDAIAGAIRIVASYLFLDAEVTKTLGDGTLSPVFNPSFPDVPIGFGAPLVGGRPFRRPAHSGSFVVSYTRDRVHISLAGYLSGKQDNSTYMVDEFGGYSMSLPNHNLLDGYQKVDLSGRYRIHRNLRWYLSVENLLNQRYEAEPGFPALPAAVRTGVAVVFGGSSAAMP